MGLHFTKEFELVNTQVAPNDGGQEQLTEVQERLIKKLGGNAYAFNVALPSSAPCSVTIDSGDDMSVSINLLVHLYSARLISVILKRGKMPEQPLRIILHPSTPLSISFFSNS